MTPIYASSTFAQSSPGVHTGWEYARTGNPTRAAFEAAVAELEGGVAGFAFASGLAAEATILELLDQGSHITAADDLYGGSWRLFERVRRRSAGLAVTYADPSDLDAFEAAIGPKTRMRRLDDMLIKGVTACHHQSIEPQPPLFAGGLIGCQGLSRPPRAFPFTAKTESLGNMQHLDAGVSVKVGDGAREPERAVIPAC